MRHEYAKASVAAVWILAITAIAMAAGVESGWGRMLAITLALAPPAAMVKLWKAPQRSMSESIQDALR
jgi:hypothetical protein